MKIREFDIKTRKFLYQLDPSDPTGDEIVRRKEISHSYLEEWLAQRFVSAEEIEEQLFFAKYYPGVCEEDIQQLANNNMVLVCTNGGTGYFATSELANLITNESILGSQPIYAVGEAMAHNAVAYGSLITSDGFASTKTKGLETVILVVDNRSRSVGDSLLFEHDSEEPLAPEELSGLLDIMGDGTMLIDTPLMRELLLPQEVADCTAVVLRQRGLPSDSQAVQAILPAYLSGDALSQLDGGMADSIDRLADELAESAVIQFRAATTMTPGIFKGTAKTSSWCARLGVDAIISTDDIKGHANGDYTPGIHTIDGQLWINRKGIAEYGKQLVGPQVKAKIPEATRQELNPKTVGKARKTGDIAIDPFATAQRQIQKAKSRKYGDLNLLVPEGVGDVEPKNAAVLASILEKDRFGQLTLLPAVGEQLNRVLSSDWEDAAIHGISVPSAMAQPHNALQPWEVCNRNLPHGAVVVYYRSPFGNVGAAAAAINNLKALRDRDPESFGKSGVSYLNPWAAEKIAITDFDSDRNGYFVGGIVNNPIQIFEEMQQQCAVGTSQERYAAGLAFIDRLLHDPSAIKVGEDHFPLAVREFVVANRPENQPQPIAKGKKVLHPLVPGQPLHVSIGRAWIKTAENPVGIVANSAMVLESLSQNITYTTDSDERKALLEQIRQTFGSIDPAQIIDDDFLEAADLPRLNLPERFSAFFTDASEDPETALANATKILNDVAQYLLAKNLQTAVDIQKSDIGIIEEFQDFAKALIYQEHAFRKDLKSPEIYRTRPLRNNTVDPVGQNVTAVNEIYDAVPKLGIDRENLNRGFRTLLPKTFTDKELVVITELVDRYKATTAKLHEISDRLKLRHRADRQPSILLTSSRTGISIAVRRVCDAQSGKWFDLAALDGQEGQFTIQRAKDNDKPHYFCIDSRDQFIGYIDIKDLEADGLKAVSQKVQETGKTHIKAISTVFPPFILENDKEHLFREMEAISDYMQRRFTGREAAMASALWSSSAGMGLALKIAPEQIINRLDRVSDINIYMASEVCQELELGQSLAVRFDLAVVDGATVPIASLLTPEGTVQPLGILSRTTPNLAPGTVVEAQLQAVLDPKIRLEVGSKRIGLVPAPEFVGKLIVPTAGEFVFREGQAAVEAYLLAEGEDLYLGQVEPSSRGKIQPSDVVVPGSYSRGEMHVSTSGKQFALQVQALIDHQPVGKEPPIHLQVRDRVLGELTPQQNLTYLPHRGASSPRVAESSAHTPSLGQLRDYYRAAVLLGYSAEEKAGIEAIGADCVRDIPPDQRTRDFVNPAISLSSEDYQKMVATIDRVLVPSRSDLMAWYNAVLRAGENNEELHSIRLLGEQQIAGTAEVDKSPNQRDPAFRNPSFRLDWSQAAKMFDVLRQPQISAKSKVAELQR